MVNKCFPVCLTVETNYKCIIQLLISNSMLEEQYKLRNKSNKRMNQQYGKEWETSEDYKLKKKRK